MGLTDIFSTSTLICLGIMLLLVGAASMFFMQKMNDQNHKISSMLGLVSTMAEELNFVRSRMQILSSGVLSSQSGGSREATYSNPQNSDNPLIPVSDDDDDTEGADDDDDDTEGADEEDDDEDDTDEDDEDEDDDTEGADDEEEEKQNIKTINMGETLDVNIHCEALAEDEDNEGEGTSSNSELEDELESLSEENLDEVENDTELTANESITLTNADFIKSIDISSLEESKNDIESFDYKKMSLNKLRSIVIEKGLASDSSKLKKNELLKMLNSE
jgi:hypothetical protein